MWKEPSETKTSPHQVEAYREALLRYPDAAPALVFFWNASGLSAGDIGDAQMQWANSVIDEIRPSIIGA